MSLQSDQITVITLHVILEVGGMVNARLEAMEPRLNPAENLQPTLAADRSCLLPVAQIQNKMKFEK